MEQKFEKKIRTYADHVYGLSCMIKHLFILGQEMGTGVLMSVRIKAFRINESRLHFGCVCFYDKYICKHAEALTINLNLIIKGISEDRNFIEKLTIRSKSG